MFRLVLILVLVPTFASAQESSDEESQTPEQRTVEFCNVRYAGSGSADVHKRLFCIEDQRIKILEARMKKGESGLANQVVELRKQLEATKAELSRQASVAQAQPSPPAGPNPKDSPQPQGPSLPAFVGGAHFGIMEVPGQFAATTWDVPGAQTLGISNVSAGARHWVRGADQVRVVVKKNGVVVPVANQDGSFDRFYADLNRDGKPDSRPYAGLDPFAFDQVFVSQVGSRDRVEVVYLVPTGKIVTVAGLSPQILWGEPTRVEMGRVDRLGRYTMHATTAWHIW